MKLNINAKSQSYTFVVLAVVAAFFLPEIAYASGGLDKVNNFMENIIAILRGASIGAVTAAIMYAGYKFIWMNATVMEVGKIVIGGLLIGGAAEIARYLLT